MADKAERLRPLHHGPPIFVVPNAWDAATARLFEAEGFPAVATTSAGVAAALGYPDGGVVPAREMIEAVARIARAVNVPVTADIEHAYAASPMPSPTWSFASSPPEPSASISKTSSRERPSSSRWRCRPTRSPRS